MATDDPSSDEKIRDLRRIKRVRAVHIFVSFRHLCTACFVTDEFAMQERKAEFVAQLAKIFALNTSILEENFELSLKIHRQASEIAALKKLVQSSMSEAHIDRS